MVDSASIVLLVVLVTIAFIHVVGEVLYKKGGMVSFSNSKNGLSLKAWARFLMSPLVIISLLITLATKVVYGVALASTPLYLAGGVYLAAIAVFSVLAGRIIFGEVLERSQLIGFAFIAIGLMLLV